MTILLFTHTPQLWEISVWKNWYSHLPPSTRALLRLSCTKGFSMIAWYNGLKIMCDEYSKKFVSKG